MNIPTEYNVPPPILGVSEVVLSVADLPRMRTFYTEVLGFPVHSESSLETETHDPNGEPTISFLIISQIDTPLGNNKHPQLLVLIDYRRHIYAKRRMLGHDVTTSTLNHLAFEIPVAYFEAHQARLQKLGIDTTLATFPRMDAKAIFFRDPEGNQLELIANVVDVTQ